MKRILIFVVALFICDNLFSQTVPTLRFRKPTVVNATTWKFSSVTAGVDAYVSVVGSKNATLDRIDDSSSFALAWQPFIKFTNSRSSASDSSYVVFDVRFVNNSTGTSDTLDRMAMTAVDIDGNSNLREMFNVELPASATTISGSSLTEWSDSSLLYVLAGTNNYPTIDTSIYDAMSQVNFTNTAAYTIRVGVLGKVSANQVRQFSFYFKPFQAFPQPLPVSLLSFDAQLNSLGTNLTWSTASEENMKAYEVCRSIDGRNYVTIGSIDASMNSNELVNYTFTDSDIANVKSPVIYYRLKMLDQQNNYKWSNINAVKTNWTSDLMTVEIFPNPVTEYINVLLPELFNPELNLSILDMNGKIVQSFVNPEPTGNRMQFDVRDFQNGVYFINIMTSFGETSSVKFIKR